MKRQLVWAAENLRRLRPKSESVDQSGHWSIQGDELEPQGQEFGQDVDLGSLCRGTREGPPPCTVAVLMSPTTNITKGNLTNEVLQKRGVISLEPSVPATRIR